MLHKYLQKLIVDLRFKSSVFSSSSFIFKKKNEKLFLKEEVR